MKIPCDNICKRLISVLSLHRVFHGIRFKVNKIGTQRSPFFMSVRFPTALHAGKGQSLRGGLTLITA